MSSLDEAIEQLRIRKAKQAYDLAELVLEQHRNGTQENYDKMMELAKRIKEGLN